MSEITQSDPPKVNDDDFELRMVDPTPMPVDRATHYGVLGAISFSHLLNDTMQSLVVAIYPLLKGDFHLSFLQIGMITLTFQLTASLLQPVIGTITDKHPLPDILPAGMCFSLAGLSLLAFAPNYSILLAAVALIGFGSSMFHPESSRVARLASGGRYGFAQSIFQIGGNVGAATAPLLAGFVVLHHGRASVGMAGSIALLAMVILLQVSRWYRSHLSAHKKHRTTSNATPYRSKSLVRRTLLILLMLIFSKYFYVASISSYYEFYLIHRFSLSAQNAMIHLFVFLAAAAAGALIGGLVGDHIGRKQVILASIFGVAPFTLLLPHAGLGMTTLLSVVIGVGIASAFPAIVVYAQDMLPHRIGMVSGLFYGLAFGMSGMGAAVLGLLADRYGIGSVYDLSAFLPLLGVLAVLLPDVRPPRHASAHV